MKELEAAVRGIEKEGLTWGGSTLVPVGFGIKKLQINLVIEDDKVGLDDLQEEIAEFEDFVQSTDIVSLFASSIIFFTSNPITGCYAKTMKLHLHLFLHNPVAHDLT
jgi:translation elongation factor EF-1beta